MIDDAIRKRYIDYIKDYSDNEDMDYDTFMEDCLNDVKSNGIRSLNPIDARILANLFLERIYKTKSESAIDAAIQLYYTFDVTDYSSRDIHKFASDIIKIYKEYN